MPAMTLSMSTTPSAPLLGDLQPTAELTLAPETAQQMDALVACLRAERDALEQRLITQEPYRALLQLQAREAGGRPMEAIAGDRLRQHLLASMTAPGDVVALVRINAALTVLSNGTGALPRHVSVPQSVSVAEPVVVAEPSTNQSSPALAAMAEPDPGQSSLRPVEPAKSPEATPTKLAVGQPVSPAAAVAHVFSKALRNGAALMNGYRPVPAPTIAPDRLPGAASPSDAMALAATESALFASIARLRGDAPNAQPPALAQPVPIDTPQNVLNVAAVDITLFAPPVAAAASTVMTHADTVALPANGPGTIPAIDRLERIRGIDTSIAARLRSLGTTRFVQIAHWTAADVAELRHQLGPDARIEQHNWIEQAALLAGGRLTRYARAVDAGNENPGRRLGTEAPPRRYGDPAFFRIGLPGARASSAWASGTRPAMPLHRPSAPLKTAPSDLPLAPELTVQRRTTPLPVYSDEPPTRPRADDEWAEVTIIPRQAVQPGPTLEPRPATESRSATGSVGGSPGFTPRAVRDHNSRALKPLQLAQSQPSGQARAQVRQVTDIQEEEAVVEIRRSGSDGVADPLPKIDYESGPLHRLLRALTPPDRKGHA
jgi:predicted flap endonuclease-1-like 5' DNA nuclease